MSWQSVNAAIESGFEFIIANKGCNPPFERDKTRTITGEKIPDAHKG